jgi:hypothetical protein
MVESAQFLESLEHDNPDRPRFTIKPGVYENLEIEFHGQLMCVPIAEVLAFARQWEADLKAQRAGRKEATTLALFPYPLMSVNLNDPDVRNLRWWPDD